MNYAFNRQGQAKQSAAPSADYLRSKRTSVFAASQLRNEREIKEFKPPVFEKTADEEKELVKQLNNSFLTKSLNQTSILVIAQSMKKIEKKAGEFIIKYGDVGNEYYILKEGRVEVLVYKKGTKPNDPNIEQ